MPRLCALHHRHLLLSACLLQAAPRHAIMCVPLPQAAPGAL